MPSKIPKIKQEFIEKATVDKYADAEAENIRTQKLQKFFAKCQYPSKTQKLDLCEATGKDMTWLGRWFCRQRFNRKKVLHSADRDDLIETNTGETIKPETAAKLRESLMQKLFRQKTGDLEPKNEVLKPNRAQSEIEVSLFKKFGYNN